MRRPTLSSVAKCCAVFSISSRGACAQLILDHVRKKTRLGDMSRSTRNFISMSFLFTFQLRNGTVPGHSDPALLKLQMAGLLWLPVELAHSLLLTNACACVPNARFRLTDTAGCSGTTADACFLPP